MTRWKIFLVALALLPVLSLNIALAQAGAVIFQDDFTVHGADGRPDSTKWGVPTNQHDPERRAHVVTQSVAERFGAEAGAKALRLFKNEQTIDPLNMALTAVNSFSKSAAVVTVAFDFWENPSIGPGTVNLRLGTGTAPNQNRVHDVTFNAGTLSGQTGLYQPGQVTRVQVVTNNSAQPVVYAGGVSVASDSYDVWINGGRVLSNHTLNRGSLAVGTGLTSLQFAVFGSNRTEFFVRDLKVYEGAVIEGPPPPVEPLTEIFLAPDGNDARDGRTLANAIRTVGRAQEILVAHSPERDVRIRILPGRYRGQQVLWNYTRPGFRIIFEAFDPEAPMPVFDGCLESGSCPGGTFLRLQFSGGRATNLEFRHLRFENYQTALSFDGNRNNLNGFNGGNVVSGCYFYRIGNISNPSVAPSTAVIRLVNSKDNIIENNDFIDAINTTSGALLHAVYVAHLSDRNFIVQNRFINHSGDPVRVRDFSNDNLIFDNVYIRAGADGYSEWYCDQAVRSDCTKPTPECPSWGNEFRHNILVSSWTGGTLGTFRFHQSDSTIGCEKPEGAVRLRTSGNVRMAMPPVELWYHRQFDRIQRADAAVSGDAAAPAGDGVPNLAKYFFNLSPWRPAVAPVSFAISDGRGGLIFTENPAASDVSAVMEASPDLISWSEIPATREVIAEGPEGVRVKWNVPEGGPPDNRQFLRLRIRR